METFMKVILGALMVVVVALLVGMLMALPVMWCWNYVMPDIFGLPELGFWQALWGTVMCKFMFPNPMINVSKK